MNITKYSIILTILCLTSCYSNTPKKEKSSSNLNYNTHYIDSIAALENMLLGKKENGKYINAFLDEYFSKHPNCFDNSIQRKKAGKELRSLLITKLKDNPDFLSDIAVKFTLLIEGNSTDNRGNKYLTTFERRSFTSTGKYNISFRIITALNEQEASKLIDNNKYYIKGKFVKLSKKESIDLSVYVGDKKTIEIGDIFIKDPSISPA